tara:strand:- start:398 stop:568 length:171 start_codon:yes stop_codon:yes gene_type:complete
MKCGMVRKIRYAGTIGYYDSLILGGIYLIYGVRNCLYPFKNGKEVKDGSISINSNR